MDCSTKSSILTKTFFKYHGAGNDFILIEDFEEDFPLSSISTLCKRSFGIGADGLILARRAKDVDFEMLYFNSDGRPASMCGNGLRCFVHFLYDLGFEQTEYRILVSNQIFTVKRSGGKISTFFEEPEVVFWKKQLYGEEVFVVDTGVPHAVIFSEEEIPFEKFRYSSVLGDVNVNQVRENADGSFSISTFERGVEAKTYACTTGAVAAAYVLHKLGKAEDTIEMIPDSKESITVIMNTPIEVIGPSKKVFEGKVEVDAGIF